MILPHETETERLLLGALFVMPPANREKAVQSIRSFWFLDPWHREIFNRMLAARGLDGRALCEYIFARGIPFAESRDGEWLYKLLCDRPGTLIGGRANCWKVYADRLRRLAEKRNRALALINELGDLIDDIRWDSYPLCEPAGRYKDLHGRVAG